MTPRRKGIRAWLVTWEWAGEHARVDQPVAAVLPWQMGAERIRWLVEQLYSFDQYEPVEILETVAARHNPYRASFLPVPSPFGEGHVGYQGEIQCGHNPWLRARVVTGLRAHEDRSLTWDERPLPRRPTSEELEALNARLRRAAPLSPDDL